MITEGDASPTREVAADAAAAALDREVADVAPFEEGMNAVYRVSFVEGADAVLKVGTETEGPRLLSGPALIRRVGEETEIPVPEVLAAVPAEAGPIDRAYALLEYVEGRTTTDVLELSPAAHERLVREAAEHLARLHELPFEDRYGRLFSDDGEDLAVRYGTDDWATAFRWELGDDFERLDDRFADLEQYYRAAADEFAATFEGDAVDPALLSTDYHPKNLVLEPDDGADPIVRTVLDWNFRPFGDAPLDVAVAEANLVDLPLGGTDRAEHLRHALRETYADARGGSRTDYFDERYPYYRLVPTKGTATYFEYFSAFGREDDPDAVAGRLRAFVRDRIEEIDP